MLQSSMGWDFTGEDAELPVGHTQNAARSRGRGNRQGKQAGNRQGQELQKSWAFLQNKDFLFVENISLKG